MIGHSSSTSPRSGTQPPMLARAALVALALAPSHALAIRPHLIVTNRGCVLRGKDRCDSCVMRSVADGISTAELKCQLIDSTARFREAQQERWAQEEADSEATFQLGREGDDVSQPDERIRSPLAAEGFGNVEIGLDRRLNELRDETIELMGSLATRNPTPKPFDGWRQESCGLDGRWDLLFTTGADATFRKTSEQGEATTYAPPAISPPRSRRPAGRRRVPVAGSPRSMARGVRSPTASTSLLRVQSCAASASSLQAIR